MSARVSYDRIGFDRKSLEPGNAERIIMNALDKHSNN